MNRKNIEKARLVLKHAGAPADRNESRSRITARLANDIETVRRAKDALRADYRRRLERWRTEDVPEDVHVAAVPTEVHESRLYRLTAVFALLAEACLAAWIFYRLGVPAVIGVMSALLVTAVLHGALLHVLCDLERPKESVYRIRRIVSLPALMAFLAAVALATLARYAHGTWAVWLVPFFTLSLWLATVSLTLLAASLFTLAHLFGWSARHEREYRKLDAEERASADFLKELESQAAGKPAPVAAQPAGPVAARPNGSAADAGQMPLWGIAVLAIALSSMGTGCSTAASGDAGQPAPVENGAAAESRPASPAALHIYIDTSGSCVRSALEECWENLRAELPIIAEAHRLDHLTLWQFDEDGWCPRRMKAIPLPVLDLPARTRAGAGEWDDFSNIREAVREAEEREHRREREPLLARYRTALAEALKPLDSAAVLPELDHQSAQSDIAGLLRRVSEMRDSQPQSLIVLTDLADSQCKTLPAIPAPGVEIRVLVLLVPAYPKDALLTTGRSLSASEQFELRSRQLREAAPWATVAPYFAGNLAALLPAKGRQIPQRANTE